MWRRLFGLSGVVLQKSPLKQSKASPAISISWGPLQSCDNKPGKGNTYQKGLCQYNFFSHVVWCFCYFCVLKKKTSKCQQNRQSSRYGSSISCQSKKGVLVWDGYSRCWVRLSLAFFKGKQTGQSCRVQFFQWDMICLDDAQWATAEETREVFLFKMFLCCRFQWPQNKKTQPPFIKCLPSSAFSWDF